jgi:acylphosphatase
MNLKCYLTPGNITTFASATARGLARECSFHPQDERPLLQSRGCTKEIAAWQAVVETLAKRFYVSGAVQGVGFRFFAEQAAVRLGIAGYVQNLFDGRVEVYAIGGEAQLDALKIELRRGPRMASVDQVAENDAKILPEFSHGFTIERDY